LTSTLLNDGRVLIAGGQGTGPVFPRLSDAEIYDPATGTFSTTGNLITPRSYFAAVLLADGRVLVAGGYTNNCSGFGCIEGDGSAEVYDPSTGRFQATGKMVTAQAGDRAVLLLSGKVLLVGGNLAQRGAALEAPAELYDPATGTFQSLGWTAAVGASATLLPNGKVLIAGGWNTPACRIYDPATGNLSPAGSLATYPIGMYWHTATLLGSGKVLITGGADDGDGVNTLANAEIYDPASGRFTDIGPMRTPRSLHTATQLPGGSVLLAGGFSGGTAELYDPVTSKFTPTGSSTNSATTATLLRNGRVLLTGGSATAELYTPFVRAISAANFAAPLAPASLASLVGSQLSASTATADPQALPTTLGGISLRVRDSAGQTRLAGLLYVSPAHINFEVPSATATGDVTLELVNAPSAVPQVTIAVRSIAPGLFTFSDSRAAAYAVRIESDGKQTVLQPGAAITLDDRPVYLTVFGTGIRNRSSPDAVQTTIGGTRVPVTYAGPGGGVTGLDQVNILLTSALKGNTDGRLVVTVDGIPSNTVLVDVH
jgi:uncharacterized protein (TIGR03437 family)